MGKPESSMATQTSPYHVNVATVCIQHQPCQNGLYENLSKNTLVCHPLSVQPFRQPVGPTSICARNCPKWTVLMSVPVILLHVQVTELPQEVSVPHERIQCQETCGLRTVQGLAGCHQALLDGSRRCDRACKGVKVTWEEGQSSTFFDPIRKVSLTHLCDVLT